MRVRYTQKFEYGLPNWLAFAQNWLILLSAIEADKH